MEALTNLNADAHTSVLKAQLEVEEQRMAVNTEQPATTGMLNCETYVLPDINDTTQASFGDWEQEEYRLPSAETEIGVVMRTLLRDMRIKRNPAHCVSLQEKRENNFPQGMDGSCVKVTQDKDAEYLHELIARKSMDGRSTDDIIDRIFWGLTNLVTKEQVAIMVSHFTKEKFNVRSKKIERQIKSVLDAGKYYKLHDRTHDNSLFDSDVVGEDTSLNQRTEEELFVEACTILKLRCGGDEPKFFTHYLKDGYHNGHAGRDNVSGDDDGDGDPTVEDTVNVGGMATAGGGAVPQSIKCSIVYGLRLILLHLKRMEVEPNIRDEVEVFGRMTHEQVGIGTGEDLIPYCYFFERLYNGHQSLADMMAEQGQDDTTLTDTEETIDTQADASQAYLHGWDFDEVALAGCRRMLKFASKKCRITNQNVYTLTSLCKSDSLAVTATVGRLFVIQLLLYVVGGRKTKYFILDNPGNREIIFDLIAETAMRMGINEAKRTKLVQAAKTSLVDVSDENAEHVNDSFHGPFMTSFIEGSCRGMSRVKALAANRRDLSYIDVGKLVQWTVKYLPPPANDNVAEVDAYVHCEVCNGASC
jgi:hypothetical protein